MIFSVWGDFRKIPVSCVWTLWRVCSLIFRLRGITEQLYLYWVLITHMGTLFCHCWSTFDHLDILRYLLKTAGCIEIKGLNTFAHPAFQFFIFETSFRLDIHFVPLHDCVPCSVGLSQKTSVKYICFFVVTFQSSRGMNTFAMHCISLMGFKTLGLS